MKIKKNFEKAWIMQKEKNLSSAYLVRKLKVSFKTADRILEKIDERNFFECKNLSRISEN